MLPWRLPEPLAREAVVPSAGAVVVAGGLTAGDQSSGSTYRLDMSDGHPTMLPDLPVPVHDVAGASSHGHALVIGGGNATEQSVVQRQAATGSWRVAAHLPSARSDLGAVTVGRRLVVVGGYDGTSPALADILLSSDGRTFRSIGRLAVPVRYPAVVASGQVVWVFGGERSAAMVDAVQRIDLASGTVRVVGRLPDALGHASACLLNGQILVLGGRTSQTTLTTAIWRFDPSTASFTRAGQLPKQLADSAVVTLRGSCYLVGGESPQFSNAVLRVRL